MVAKSGKKKRKLNSKTIRQMLLIRKKFPEAFTAEGIVSCAVEPVLVNPIILIKAVMIFYSFFRTVVVWMSEVPRHTNNESDSPSFCPSPGN